MTICTKMVTKVGYFERFQWITNTLFHQILAVITAVLFWTIFVNYDVSATFTWHIVLCTFAYIPLMAEAIILFARENVWTQYLERLTRSRLHGVILLVSAIVVSAGNYIAIDHSRRHFRTKHGWTGLVSWILVLLSQILGLFAHKPKIFQNYLRPVWLKYIHNIIGIMGYVFGVVSLIYGYSYLKRYLSATLDEWLIPVTCIILVWSLYNSLISGYNQMKDIFL